jgi:thiosulfate dehydrogenase
VRVALVFLLALTACERSAAEYGSEVFRDPGALSASRMNTFACSDCHATADGDDRLLPGYDMRGVAARGAWWGGQAATLADAVDACLLYFMRASPLDRDSEKARALYEYLLSITPEGSPTEPLPMTVVENVVAVPLGDATRGAEIYRRACGYCHGDVGTGRGQILDKPVILPDVASEYDMLFPGVPRGLVFIDVTRHGRFFGVGGTMPFFSKEILSDADIGDLLAYLQLSPV